MRIPAILMATFFSTGIWAFQTAVQMPWGIAESARVEYEQFQKLCPEMYQLVDLDDTTLKTRAALTDVSSDVLSFFESTEGVWEATSFPSSVVGKTDSIGENLGAPEAVEPNRSANPKLRLTIRHAKEKVGGETEKTFGLDIWDRSSNIKGKMKKFPNWSMILSPKQNTGRGVLSSEEGNTTELHVVGSSPRQLAMLVRSTGRSNAGGMNPQAYDEYEVRDFTVLTRLQNDMIQISEKKCSFTRRDYRNHAGDRMVYFSSPRKPNRQFVFQRQRK